LLELRHALVDQLTESTERLERAQLFPTAGNRWLLARLHDSLGAAEAAFDQLADGTRSATAIQQVQEQLDTAEWITAEESARRSKADVAEQDAIIRTLTEDLATIRLWFDRYRREMAAAMAVGAEVSAEDQQLLADVDGRIQQADQDSAQGRYDTVATAVASTRQTLERLGLWEPAAFEKRIKMIAAARDAAARREAEMSCRAELFLIAAPPTSEGNPPDNSTAPVEYRVLLRRPSFEATQESNLHDSMRIETEDRQLFRSTIDEVADAASGGVRGDGGPAWGTAAGEAGGTGRTQPAGWEEPGDGGPAKPAGWEEHRAVEAPAGPSAEPVRGIQPVGGHGDAGDPAERLERIGRLIYSLLIPDAMQQLIDDIRGPLTVTSNDLELPWELMHDGNEFLCLQRPFARMPVGQTFPRRTRRRMPAARAIWNVLLVHSDPAGDLSDSRAEITEIERVLRELPVWVNIEVLAGERATRNELTHHLSSGRYDLIHYAGHAGFDLAEPAKSYLLLHNGQRFSAERVQKVLEGRPIVFLNACDTCRSNNEGPSARQIVARAQGLAWAFIYGGAQACVGTLWPVFDDSARDLATTFYSRLVARRRVGEALCEARATSYDKHGDRLTWAAYALYGDPLCRLREGASAPQAPTST
jgi:CHAT domain